MVQDINNVVNGKQPAGHPLYQRYDINKVKRFTIDIFCTGCDGDESGMWELGPLINAWEKVTGSRYMQIEASRKLKPDAITLGDSIAANKGTALEGCILQTIFCGRSSCKEKLGFICIGVPPPKQKYKNRQFLQLDKLVLRDRATGALDVAPIMGDHHILKDDTKGQSAFASTPLQAQQRTDEIAADQAAVEATNGGLVTWKDAHEAWLARTHRELSPGAFGRHILALGGGKNPKSPFVSNDNNARMSTNPTTQSPAVSKASGSTNTQQPPMAAAATSSALPVKSTTDPRLGQPQSQGVARPAQVMQQEQGSTPRPSPAMTRPHLPTPQNPTSNQPIGHIHSEDSLEKQRQDINRIDSGVKYLHNTLTTIAQQVNMLRQEIRGRPGAVTDDSAVDILTQNLSTVMTKTAEIDSLKMQLSVLQRRMKRLEDGPGSATSLTQADAKNETDGSQSNPLNLQVPTGTPGPTLSTANSATINSAKRPLSESSQPEPKRQKQGEAEFYAHDPGSTQTPAVAISASPYFTSHQGSPDLWQSAIQPLNIFQQPSPKRGPGRPRKYPALDQSMPTQTPHSTVWAQTPTSEAPYDAEYYSTQDPNSLDRGLVVRRGGGAFSGAYMSPVDRRGRSKPIRNEQGVLIRKDGKPDRRSQTSAENLRRTMNRKAEEALLAGSQSRLGSAQIDGTNDRGRSQFGESPSALLDGDGETGYDMDMDEDDMDDEGERSVSVDSISPVNMQGLESSNPLAAFKTRENQPIDSVPSQQPVQATPTTTTAPETTTHPEIMRKMFPHGMTEEQRRMDFSGQLFRTSTPSEAVREKPVARMTQRADMDVGGSETAARTARVLEQGGLTVPAPMGTTTDSDRQMTDMADTENVIAVDDDDGEQVGDIPP